MTELVSSHTASIRKFEMQMRDLSREQNPKQKGTLSSDTIANPKGSGSGPTSHIMTITTRSGKVIQGESEQVVELEDSKQEVEAQVEEQIVVEAKEVPEELKVQEVNREELKEKVKEAPKTLPPIPKPHPTFPQRLARKVDDSKLEKFYDILKQLLVSSITATTTVQKKEDPQAFTIPCTVGARDFARALCDSGTSIN
ncbi:PREDICTED: uncharacterized protein LOC109244032 [Nicotiana attenuata]|uniref:uncharacterized protein LOC109244032 n=1 Tax=Nicotiana attenuata TaxID=49451 RepID=UPI0009058A93|nr:PREDICTED: uncharacterized protein LOC109244032 [Nicotiana attenuata]